MTRQDRNVVLFSEALGIDDCPPLPPLDSYSDQDCEPISGAGVKGDNAKRKVIGPFKFTAVDDLEYRNPEFLVGGLIETDGLGMIFGDPGCGKSFIAADLALCVASGVDFHGRDVKQGTVMFIAGEGHNGLTRRFAAWSAERGVPLVGLPMFKSDRAAQFLDGASAKAVADAVDTLVDRQGAPALVVVDTVARNFGAGDENSTQDMSNFIVAMDDLKARYPGCVVLLIHHSGHAEKGRARGAMALKGALDFEFRAEKDGHRIQIINTKMKDAEPPADIHLELVSIHLRGDARSAVLRGADAPIRKERITPTQKLALDTYETAARDHGVKEDGAFRGVHVDAWRDAFYAKHTGDNVEAKKKAFQRVRADMVSAGKMSVLDDVYLVRDAAIQVDLVVSGTSGTRRDISQDVPMQKRDEAGQMPKACPAVPPRLGEWGERTGIRTECPDVPMSRLDAAASDDPFDPEAWA